MTLNARTARLYPLIILVLALAEVSFLSVLKPFALQPDLLLITVVLASLWFRIRWVLLIGLYAGLLKDAFSLYPHGLYAAAFPLIGFGVIKLSRKISFDEAYVKIILIFLIAFCLAIAKGIAFMLYGWPLPFFTFIRVTLAGSLSCAVFAFFLIKVFEQ